MKIRKTIKKIGFTAIMLVFSMMTFSSCDDGFIYDEEGDCTVHYKLQFFYDMNLKWADAFSNEVKSVRVYAFDENENLVKIFMENDPSIISEPNYAMDLDLEPGNYHLIAWCGIDNINPETKVSIASFSAPENMGMKMQDLDCKLNWKSNALFPAYSDEHLQFTFWGELKDVEIVKENLYGGVEYFRMPLIKDTNHLRVQLVQLSGEDTDVNDFTYSIEAVNGEMDYLNNLIGDTKITYLPWHLMNGEVGMEQETKALTYANSAIADLDLSRMTVGEIDSMRLVIRNSEDNSLVANVPIIQYSLLSKMYYEEAYGHDMTDQEFLDRQDEYNMTFFLDSNMKWVYATIDILSWRVVIQNVDLGS